MFLLLCLIQVWQLLRHGAVLPAAMVAVGAGGVAWGIWCLLRGAAAITRKLRLYPDGRAQLCQGDAATQVRLDPCSLRLGRHALLVFRGSGRRPLRLLVGPGILSAQDLAALGRWLQRAPVGEGTGAGLLR